ncbi:MAG: type II secretion system protein [Pirellulales bacterium]|nr:type II secretion system protein [Pirellulales bacterium]
MKTRRTHCRQAFTLLEVILALAILGGAVALLGEIMRMANRGAVDARAETQAELLALSVMDELESGYADLASVTRQPLSAVDPETVATDGPWVCSVAVGTSQIIGIVPVEVLVEQDLEQQFNPVRYRLVRWFAEISPSADASSSSAGGGSGGGSL